jgi:predicted acetyltransferase
MTELVVPDLRWYDDWVATLTDFGEEYPHGSGCPQEGQALDRSAFEEFVADRLRYADPTAELPHGWVSCDFLWIVDAGEMIGFLALRHRLTDFLLDQGGHIGYSVRPARRREGHASRALALAVARAAELGLDRVLVTCDEDNLGSRRTIESGGGELEDVRTGKRRYWISTADGRVGDMIAR